LIDQDATALANKGDLTFFGPNDSFAGDEEGIDIGLGIDA
jgi:hypothetical protein